MKLEQATKELGQGLTIRRFRVRGLNLTLGRGIETASGIMTTTPLVLLDVFTEQGITGSSYVRCYTPLALAPLAQLLRALEPELRGDLANPVAVERKLQRLFRLLGPQGLTGIAMAAIDMALWDVCARARGEPLVVLLGGEPRLITAYASLRSMHPEAAAAEAEELVSAGFTALKIKLGRSDLAADLTAIHSVRRAAGESTRLMVDYNQCLSLEDALERVRILDGEGLYWIEEPTLAEDYFGHARIAAAARTPIQLGENWWGPLEMDKSIRARASDHVMLDVMKLGGVSGWLRAATLAQCSGLPASSHTFPEFSAHLLAVTPTAHFLEYLDHVAPILQEPIRVQRGCAIISDRPGAGLEWNEYVIAGLLSQ